MKKIKKSANKNAKKNRGGKLLHGNFGGNFNSSFGNGFNSSFAGSFGNGFTLIEILMVMGIIALLAAMVIVAINPARQFAQARNSQRVSNVNSILNAVGQNIADHRGVFDCEDAGALPSVATVISSDTNSDYDLAPCITPLYLPSIPFDPSAPGAHFTNLADYDTGYTIFQDANTGRITVSAPFAQNPSELEEEISATR